MTAQPPLPCFCIVLPVWGGEYVRAFLEYSLPSLLAQGNLPAVAKQGTVAFLIYTKETDRAALQGSAQLRRLERFAQVEIITPGHRSKDAPDAYLFFSECYRQGLQRAHDRGAACLFLTADQIWADGALKSICARSLEGWRVVLLAAPRVLQETVLPALDALRGEEGDFADRLAPRTLAKLAYEHLHPWDRSLFWNADGVGRPASFLYWDVPGAGFLMHCLHLHPVCVSTGNTEVPAFRHTIDGGDFIRRVARDTGQCYIARSSDEVMYFSFAPAEQSAHLLDYPAGDWKRFAHWALSMGVSRHNLAFLQQGIRFCLPHAAPEAWAKAEVQAQQLCGKVRQYLDRWHLLLYARLYFACNVRFGQRLRSCGPVVRWVKKLRNLLGLGY